MKKISILLLCFSALLSAVVSCEKERTAPQNEDSKTGTVEVPEGYELRTFGLTAPVKTSLSGTVVSWVAGDEVAIYSEDGSSVTGSVSFVDEKPVISVAVPSSANYYAVYPASTEAEYDSANDKLNVTIPEEQTGVWKDVNYICAKTSSADASFAFHHICMYFKLELPAGIKKAFVYSSDNSTKLCGVVACNFDGSNNLSAAWSDGGNTYVDVKPASIDSSVSKEYYLAVVPNASVPGLAFRMNPGLKTGLEAEWYPMFFSSKSFTTTAGDILPIASSLYADKLQYDYFITTDGTGDGSSWENAAGPSDFKALVEAGSSNLEAYAIFNRKFHFAEGEYEISITPNAKTNTIYTVDGSYPASLTGTSTASRDTAAHATVFKVPSASASNSNILYLGTSRDNITFDGITFAGPASSGTKNGKQLIQIAGSNASKFTSCVFKDAYCSTYGAAVLINSAAPVFEKCTFTGNVADAANGGAVYLNGSSSAPEFKNCSFTSNKAANGGALCSSNALSLNVTGGDFTGNEATTLGGAVSLAGIADASFSGVTFDGNTSVRNGAAIRDNGVTNGLNIEGCSFKNNNISLTSGTASYTFGVAVAITAANNTVNISGNSSFYKNTVAFTSGTAQGGVLGATASGCSFFVSDTDFTYNETGYQGGSVLCDTQNLGLSAYFTDCSFHYNKANKEGTAYGVVLVLNNGFCGLHNCTFTQSNTSTGSPRCYINIAGGKVIMLNSTVVGDCNSTSMALVRHNSTNASTFYAANNVAINAAAGATGAIRNSAIGGVSSAAKGTSKGWNYTSACYFSVTATTDLTGYNRNGFTLTGNKYYTWTCTRGNNPKGSDLSPLFSEFDTANSVSNGKTFLDWLQSGDIDAWGKDQLGHDRGDSWWPGAYQAE